MSKRRGKQRAAKPAKPTRAPSRSAAASKPAKPRSSVRSSRRPGDGMLSALAWFAISCLVVWAVTCQPAWPWAANPIVGSIANWPGHEQIFPDRQAVLTLLWSTSAIFFLLVPLANWPLPRRVLRKSDAAPGTSGLGATTGYWLMWLAVAVFAAIAFVPGTPVAVARPAVPEGTFFWRATSGQTALIAWLAAVVLVWLAAVLVSAGRLERIHGQSADGGRRRCSPEMWGMLLAAWLQLLLYPFLTALACSWLLDLAFGSEVFVSPGTLPGSLQASTGGGPTALWLSVFSLATWPTLLVSCVPLIGVAAGALLRTAEPSPSETTPDAESEQAATADSATGDPPAQTGNGWAIRGLVVAAYSFLAGIFFAVLLARWSSSGGYPVLRELGFSFWLPAAGVVALALSDICLRRGAAGQPAGAAAGWWKWITVAILLAVLGGGVVVNHVRTMVQRGLYPGRTDRLLFDRADLYYASAVRLRLEALRGQLDTREADAGSLSPHDQKLHDLCRILLIQLIQPAEIEAVETDDPGPLASLAVTLAAHTDSRPDIPEGADAELTALVRRMQENMRALQLPRVVPGGRQWVGVQYLLTAVVLVFVGGSLLAIFCVVATRRGSSRAAALRSLAPFLRIAVVSGVLWLLVG